jgi:hypothetical protein
VGRDEQVNLDQPEKLTEQMRLSEGLINSDMDLDQRMQLTEEEDMRNLLMIGGFGIFLPFAQEEANVCVADDAATKEEQSQLTMTVREEEELEQVFETAQAQAELDEEDDDHSEEWLNIFIQEDENTATGEVAKAEEEGEDKIFFVDLWEQIESLEERVKVQGVHIQQVKLETDEGGMGDHGDLLICQNFL